MDEIRAEAQELYYRAARLNQKALEDDITPEQFAAWLDEEFLSRNPQAPLSNLLELIAEF